MVTPLRWLQVHGLHGVPSPLLGAILRLQMNSSAISRTKTGVAKTMTLFMPLFPPSNCSVKRGASLGKFGVRKFPAQFRLSSRL